MILGMVLLAGVLGQAGKTGSAVTPPGASAQVEVPKEDAAVTALALKIYGQMRAGKVDNTLLTEKMAAALTPETLADTRPMLEQLGDPTKLTLEKKETISQATAWTYLAIFPAAQFHVLIVLDAAGKVAGYRLLP